MNTGKTDRGFDIIEFQDANHVICSIQQSSAIDFSHDGTVPDPGTTMLWLGCNEADQKILASQARQHGIKTEQTTGWIPFPVPDEVLQTTRMHLNRNQVAVLVKRLQRWLDTGSLEIDPERE